MSARVSDSGAEDRKLEPDLIELLNPTARARLIKRTLEFWQPRSPGQLTEEDARQIIYNVTGFFRLLARWDAEARAKECEPGEGNARHCAHPVSEACPHLSEGRKAA